jgi:hypothetical protein
MCGGQASGIRRQTNTWGIWHPISQSLDFRNGQIPDRLGPTAGLQIRGARARTPGAYGGWTLGYGPSPLRAEPLGSPGAFHLARYHGTSASRSSVVEADAVRSRGLLVTERESKDGLDWYSSTSLRPGRIRPWKCACDSWLKVKVRR